jgi:adenylate kinase
MKVLITGTPGTGKTLVAEALGELTGWDVLHITEIAEEARAVLKGDDGESEVDMPKLCAYLTPILKEKEDVIFEGHLGCEIPCPADLVVVLRTNPLELEKRMEKRGYVREKIDENIMAELLDYCYQLSEWYYSCEVVELDTTGRSAPESAERIFAYINGDIGALDTVSWAEYLERKTGKPEKKPRRKK